MNAQQPRSSQRTLIVRAFGLRPNEVHDEKLYFGIPPWGVTEATPEPEIDMGSPALRTRWEIQSLTLTWESAVFSTATTPDNVFVGVDLLVDREPTDLSLLQFKTEKGTNEVKVGRRAIVLELFSPVIVERAQLLVRFKLRRENEGGKENEGEAKISRPQLVATVQQTYPI